MTNHISFQLQILKIPVCRQGFLPFQIFVNVNLDLYITHTSIYTSSLCGPLGSGVYWRLTSYIAQNRTRSYLVQKSRGVKVRCLYSVLEVSASCLRPALCTHNSQVTCLFGSLLLISGVILFSSFFLKRYLFTSSVQKDSFNTLHKCC